jgi:hypothetical protein
MTVVTLMTVICGLILDEGMPLYFVGSLTLSTLPDEPDAQSKESLTYAIFEATRGVGLSGRLDKPDAATRRTTLFVGFVRSIVGAATST